MAGHRAEAIKTAASLEAEQKRARAGREAAADAALRQMGAEICRWVLGLDEDEIADIRNQHNVGADAVDQLDNFYEYKVHAGPVPDVIGLEPSQIERALTTPNFFLVVIGNLQAGVGDPEVRIITNPLDQLVPRPTASVQYSGVLAARALTYRFTLDSDASDDPEETDSGDPAD
jgi:hypothetical protein